MHCLQSKKKGKAKISVKIDDEELVQIALNSFSPSWEACVGCLCLITPVDFEKSLEHIRPRRKKGKKTMEGKVIEAQDLALIGKVRKGGKKGPRKGKSDNATYLETRMGSISFWMPSSDVLKAHYV